MLLFSLNVFFIAVKLKVRMKCCHTHNIHIRNFYDCIQQFHIEIIILLRSRVFLLCCKKREKNSKVYLSIKTLNYTEIPWNIAFFSFFYKKNIIKWNMKWNTVRYAYTIYNVMFRRIIEILFFVSCCYCCCNDGEK